MDQGPLFGRMWHPASSSWIDLGPPPSQALSDRYSGLPYLSPAAEHGATGDPPQHPSTSQLGQDPHAPLQLPPAEGSDQPLQDDSYRSEDEAEDYLSWAGGMATLERWRPELIARTLPPSDSLYALSSKLASAPLTRQSRPNLVAPQIIRSLWESPATQARGAPVAPPTGIECLSAPRAAPVGTFLRDSKRANVLSLVSDNPLTREIVFSPADCRLIPHRATPTSANLSVKHLIEWDRMARTSALHSAAGHTYLDLLLQRVEAICSEEGDA